MTDARNLVVALVLAFDADVRQRIQHALHAEAVVRFVSTAEECLHLATRGSAAVLLIELSPRAAAHVTQILYRLRNRGSTPRIVGYALADQNSAAVVLTAAHAGLDALIYRAADDSAVLRKMLSGQSVPFREGPPVILGVVNPLIPAALQPFLREALEHPGACETVAQLAYHLRMGRTAFASQLRQAGGPKPERFQSWCQLLWVAYALQTTPWSIERIAHALQLASGSAVSHLTKRYVELTPKALRVAGALLTTARAFARECEWHKERYDEVSANPARKSYVATAK